MNDLISTAQRRRMPDRVENTSGRAAFDRELSALSRRESGDRGTLLPWPMHRAQSTVAVAPPPHCEQSAALRRRKVEQVVRRKLWDLIADGMSLQKAAAKLGVSSKTARRLFGKGRPPGADWSDVGADDLTSRLGSIDERAEIAAMMNAAARRWNCPATALFGRDSRSVARVRAVSDARTEVAIRLRIGRRYSLLRCAGLMRMNNCSILAAIRRGGDERFAFLQIELNDPVAARGARDLHGGEP